MRDRDFERLVRSHHRAVHTYAHSMASSPTIAEDAVQNTFLRAWQYLDSFRGRGSFEGWLIRICRRCVIDLERQQTRHHQLTQDNHLRSIASEAQAADHQPETLALIANLSQEQREVIVVCGVLGYDYDTAATILDIPVGTVRSRLHRARATLADALRAQPPERASA